MKLLQKHQTETPVSTEGNPKNIFLLASLGGSQSVCCGGGLTLDLRYVGELFGVAAVSGLFPLQLQEDGDGPLDLCAVIGRRLEHDGVLTTQTQTQFRILLLNSFCSGSVQFPESFKVTVKNFNSVRFF